MGYRKSAHATYDLKVHLVWITKCRKPVLRGAVALRLRELIRQNCATLEVEIIKGHVAVDHVHLLVSVPPKVSVSQLIQRVKGRSSAPTAEFELIESAVGGARRFVADRPKLEGALERVRQLLEGFETPYGMELLATGWAPTEV